jgi:hypothetical protein
MKQAGKLVRFVSAARDHLYDVADISAKELPVELARAADSVLLGGPADSFAGEHRSRTTRQP